MKTDSNLINTAEAYLRGELSPVESKAFETLRASDPIADQAVVAHYSLMKQLADFGSRQKIKAELEDIHSELDVAAIRRSVLPSEVVVKRLWAKHRFNLAIAASVAILAVLSTLLTTGYFTKDEIYRELALKIDRQGKDINTVKNHISHGPVNPGSFEGTGFAYSSDCIISNYHIIKGADSIYIQNADGESFKVESIYNDPVNDIAVLKVRDQAFTPFNSLPYTIKKSVSGLGEDVYTIGYPRDDDQPVIGKGYLSSQTGYKGDTTAYQVSIDANPGNSGSPILDYKGNIVGMIKRKNFNKDGEDGAVFATRSDFMLEAISTIPADSLKLIGSATKKNTMAHLGRVDQINKMKDYIFIVKAYK